MYKRIVLAYDGSKEGRATLREGALLAKQHGAKVFLLSVVADSAAMAAAEGTHAGAVSVQESSYAAVLADGLQHLEKLGFTAQAKLVRGQPAKAIAAFAKEIGADLVVVGHRRQSMFSRWWFGPTAGYLSDHVECSVLVARSAISDEAFESEFNKG